MHLYARLAWRLCHTCEAWIRHTQRSCIQQVLPLPRLLQYCVMCHGIFGVLLQRRKELKQQLGLPEDYGVPDSDSEQGEQL